MTTSPVRLNTGMVPVMTRPKPWSNIKVQLKNSFDLFNTCRTQTGNDSEVDEDGRKAVDRDYCSTHHVLQYTSCTAVIYIMYCSNLTIHNVYCSNYLNLEN